MGILQLGLYYQLDGLSRRDAWYCPHCDSTTDDRPWVYFLFSWHRMDCLYRHALKKWVTFACPCGVSKNGGETFREITA